MSTDPWASPDLAHRFVDEAYASVKGYVRTFVLHRLLPGRSPLDARNGQAVTYSGRALSVRLG